ncbi:dUTP diphosphatase [Staphylococcus rostri]
MSNQLTVEQLQELLQIQKDFDDRIPTLNLEDSKIAYIVEFFEWFNTLETFKNWKKNPGKPLEVQLDELADMLAFGLSIANQQITDAERFATLLSEVELPGSELLEVDFGAPEFVHATIEGFSEFDFEAGASVLTPFVFAYRLYSVDQLIDAYKKKMERNHARQDGTADVEKGYV